MLTSPTGTFDLFVTTDSDSFINVIVAGPVLWIQKKFKLDPDPGFWPNLDPNPGSGSRVII